MGVPLGSGEVAADDRACVSEPVGRFEWVRDALAGLADEAVPPEEGDLSVIAAVDDGVRVWQPSHAGTASDERRHGREDGLAGAGWEVTRSKRYGRTWITFFERMDR